MPRSFVNPSNGYQEQAGSILSPLWCLLFGPLYLICAGLWQYAVFYSLVLLMMASWLGAAAFVFALAGNLFFAFLVLDALEKNYLRRGWREVARDEEEENDLDEKTPSDPWRRTH